jgi:hypothetical protein
VEPAMAGNRVEPDTPSSAGGNGASGIAREDITIVIPESRQTDAFHFRERRSSKRAYRGPQRIRGRLLVGLVSVILGAGTGLLAAQLLNPEQPPRPRVPGVGPGEVPGPVVPETAGLSAAEARNRLLASNLQVVRVVPTPGEPGVVMRSRPGAGRPVTPGMAVILYIGVDEARFEQESNTP